MNKQQVLNSNSIGKIQNLLRDSLHKGLDPLIPCIEFLKIPRQFRDDKVINMIVTILKKFKPFTSFLNIANEDELKKLLYEFALNAHFKQIKSNTVLVRNGEVENTFYLVLSGHVTELNTHIEKRYLSKKEYISYLLKLYLLKEKKLFKETILLNKPLFPLSTNINEWKINDDNIDITSLLQSISTEIEQMQLNGIKDSNKNKFYLSEREPFTYREIVQPKVVSLTNFLTKEYFNVKTKMNNLKYYLQIPIYHTQHILSTGNVIGSLIPTKLIKSPSTYVIDNMNVVNVAYINKFEKCQSSLNDLYEIVLSNMKQQSEIIYKSFYIFHDIPLDIFKNEIAKYFSYRKVNKDEYIIKQDSNSDNVYFIIRGHFNISTYSSFNEVNQLIADLQNSLNHFHTNRFITPFTDTINMKESVYKAFGCDKYITNPLFRCVNFNIKCKNKQEIIVQKCIKKSILGLNDFYHCNHELYHFNVQCVSDDGGEMFVISKEIFNSIMKRYQCIMGRCGFFVEERIKAFTLKLNKYKEDFMKEVNNTRTIVAKRNKMKHLFMKKSFSSSIRLSLNHMNKTCNSTSGLSLVGHSDNSNQSFAINSMYDSEKKKSMIRSGSTISASTRPGSTLCLYDKKWLKRKMMH